MKKFYIQIIAMLLLLSLTACSFFAAPPTPSGGTEGESTGPVQENCELWSQDPIASQFAAPPLQEMDTGVMIVDKSGFESVECPIPHNPCILLPSARTFWFPGGDYGEMLAYANTLQDSGYNQCVIQKDDPQAERFIFCGCDEKGNSICINYRWLDEDLYQYADAMTEKYSGYITVCYNLEKAPQSSEHQTWGNDAYQKILPKPEIQYSKEKINTSAVENAEFYAFQLDNAGYSDAVAYSQQLIASGFQFQIQEYRFPYSQVYYFQAENKDGYMVNVDYSGMYDTAVNVRVVDLNWTTGRGWEDITYLPSPPVNDWRIDGTAYASDTKDAGNTIVMQMDYSQAIAYLQGLKDFGYTSDAVESVEEDTQKIQYTACAHFLDEDRIMSDYDLRFQYADGQLTLCIQREH